MDDFQIWYSPADAYETGYGWNLVIDGHRYLFTTEESARAEVQKTPD